MSVSNTVKQVSIVSARSLRVGAELLVGSAEVYFSRITNAGGNTILVYADTLENAKAGKALGNVCLSDGGKAFTVERSAVGHSFTIGVSYHNTRKDQAYKVLSIDSVNDVLRFELSTGERFKCSLKAYEVQLASGAHVISSVPVPFPIKAQKVVITTAPVQAPAKVNVSTTVSRSTTAPVTPTHNAPAINAVPVQAPVQPTGLIVNPDLYNHVGDAFPGVKNWKEACINAGLNVGTDSAPRVMKRAFLALNSTAKVKPVSTTLTAPAKPVQAPVQPKIKPVQVVPTTAPVQAVQVQVPTELVDHNNFVAMKALPIGTPILITHNDNGHNSKGFYAGLKFPMEGEIAVSFTSILGSSVKNLVPIEDIDTLQITAPVQAPTAPAKPVQVPTIQAPVPTVQAPVQPISKVVTPATYEELSALTYGAKIAVNGIQKTYFCANSSAGAKFIFVLESNEPKAIDFNTARFDIIETNATGEAEPELSTVQPVQAKESENIEGEVEQLESVQPEQGEVKPETEQPEQPEQSEAEPEPEQGEAEPETEPEAEPEQGEAEPEPEQSEEPEQGEAEPEPEPEQSEEPEPEPEQGEAEPEPEQAEPEPEKGEAEPEPEQSEEPEPEQQIFVDYDFIQQMITASVQGATEPLYAIIADLTEALNNVQTSGVQTLHVSINGAKPKKLKCKQVHKKFKQLLIHATVRDNCLMVGGAGSGKTTAARQIAEALDLPFSFTAICGQTSESRLFGYMSATGEYVSTAFRQAYEHGGVFLLDEIDAGNANVVTALNAAIDNKIASFPDEIIEQHPDFILFAGANTAGHGANRMYAGRNQLDGATLDRFSLVPLEYDNALERKISGNDAWSAFVQAARAELAGERVIISPRASIAGAKLLAAGMKPELVLEARMLGGLEAAAQLRIKAIYARFEDQIKGTAPVAPYEVEELETV